MRTEITNFLEEKGIEYNLLQHEEPALTCEKAAKERDVPLDEMIKSMIFLDGDERILVAVVTANREVDLKNLKEESNTKNLKFAGEEDVREKLDYKMGAIPPFFPEKKDKSRVFVDSKVFWNDKVNFSSGDPSAGIEISLRDFRNIMEIFEATKANISK